MQHATTLAEYCRLINVPPPRAAHYDVRRFEDNMRTVNRQQPPFRHEFYAVALRRAGTNRQVNGQELAVSLFFNTPYQLIGWDIEPDWEGWYLLFDDVFARCLPGGANFLSEFPFLALDKSVPFAVPPADVAFLDALFQQLWREHHGPATADQQQVICAYAHLLLLYVRRHYAAAGPAAPPATEGRAADLRLVADLQSAVERHQAAPGAAGQAVRTVGFYADLLGVSPNHLNAVVKRLTGKTASQLVQDHTLAAAKALLLLTDRSVKEIGYQLCFTDPTHFVGFFKKHTGQTPKQYRAASPPAAPASELR